MRRLLLFLTLLTGCNTCPDKVPPFVHQTFTGRDEEISDTKIVRRPVYRAKVPTHWVRIDPEAGSSLADTTKPNASFLIDEGLLLTVYSFPSKTLEGRIPPQAQVQRWIRQLKDNSPEVQPVHQGGFSGLFLEGSHAGRGVMAWAMQLDPNHFLTLKYIASTPEEEAHTTQMGADYTLKVEGPIEFLETHREEISFFAKSFELIQEIPARS